MCLGSIDRYRSLFQHIRLFHTDMRVLLSSPFYAIRGIILNENIMADLPIAAVIRIAKANGAGWKTLKAEDIEMADKN